MLVLLVLAAVRSTTAAQPAHAEADSASFGYGFNVADWDLARVQSMGFNWIKVFSPPGSRLPVQVLMRVDANASHLGNTTAFGNELHQLAQQQKGTIDAYEIGNEPNLDATYGWGYGSVNVPPDAADYANLLCVAYNRIKAADPNALVVSAGLAPTGRVSGNWNGHPGHNGLYQDEREFFKEFLAAGGGACLDAVGYHPYGFGADYDAEPDAYSDDATRRCVNGFCFRGVEGIYQLMQAHGLGHKKVWATEFGWIVHPPAHCLADPGWQGRQWQIVSEARQATNLRGSFEYATANWPWMGAMFVFNLNFNTAPWYHECEQMRFYGVVGRPAEAALRDMPKVSGPATGRLEVSPRSIAAVVQRDQQPFSHVTTLQLGNTGTQAFNYTVTADSNASLTPTISGGTGTLNPGEQKQVQVTIQSNNRAVGAYSGAVTISTSPNASGAPVFVPVTLFVFREVHRSYLPSVIQTGQ